MNWRNEQNIIFFLILHRTRWKSHRPRGKSKNIEIINDFVVKLSSVVTNMLQRQRTLQN